ncbi:hypothetical protein [Staphylococcus chromogenes]|nr:hypothetical protein [Staphylococcus chromogenes]
MDQIVSMKIYEFVYDGNELRDIKEPKIVGREEIIKKINNDETFVLLERTAEKKYFITKTLHLSVNQNGFIHQNKGASCDKI